ncbi:diphosphomevalonate/mevalonate 3,5-bisphosphate decarboxylase family protein [Lentiprolixibacter aurantiacus]|uniref:Diphosphomevalonate decarboxylase n=1 Tax=Lentiprolixibacter aurantiacus TaxID=2993939 RepID=A0AAE3MI86_9FLAO|nr:diphosphomevalonate decarboxylase [Lentiprolixibacter aurantiacus]MCX2718160.1 diphosphomevalonate decarboxylase [Lentiprolixibacter aurantiacus]
MTEKDFIPSDLFNPTDQGVIHSESPSNIALVKYWGKFPDQIPANPSISFTLDTCATSTTVEYNALPAKTGKASFEFFFEGKPKPDFEPKLQTFFDRTAKYLPFLKNYHLKISSSNSFPHSSGIASSASAMAALASSLVELERRHNPEMDRQFANLKSSFLARLGSGSACRSISGSLVVWGEHADIPGSSDLYGVPFPDTIAKIFQDYQDTILLVHRGQKQVSSTVGHKLMEGHPFAKQRFEQAHSNLRRIKEVMISGDLDAFVDLVEREALTLHAMMMTSSPYFILMKPNTLSIIEKVWEFRRNTGLPLCFTLDAGANVHLLYPGQNKEKVLQFIKNELVAYCENGQYICDQLGEGTKIS